MRSFRDAIVTVPISSPTSPYPDTLVWGACGFIGRHLVAELCRRGARVSVLTRARDRYPVPSWADEVRWFELPDGPDADGVMRRAVAGAAVIFNFAGSTGAADSNLDPLGSLESNNRAQLLMLEACRASRARPHVVFTSSRLVYGRPVALPVNESHVLNPASMYAAHKLCCEHYHRIYATSDALTCTIARISNAFGADPAGTKHHGMINVFVRQSLAGRAIELFGDGGQMRDYLYVPDLVSVLLECGTQRAAVNETFNVGSGTGTSLREAAEQIAAATGGPAVRSVPWPRSYEVVETGDYRSDISKVRTTLGFTPRWPFAAGLADMIAAYRAGGSQP